LAHAEELPAFADYIRARFPGAPEDMKPYPETMYVQFVKRQLATGKMILYGAVMDKRTHRISQSFPGPTQTKRRPLEIVYAISEPCLQTFEAVWTLLDAVMWKQIAGQPPSPGYLVNIENLANLESDEWAVIAPDTGVLASPPSPPRAQGASSSGRGARGNATRKSISPPDKEDEGDGMDNDGEFDDARESSRARCQGRPRRPVMLE
jgi:hypothetical protein